jgi:hypothetical protein
MHTIGYRLEVENKPLPLIILSQDSASIAVAELDAEGTIGFERFSYIPQQYPTLGIQ